MSKYLNAARMVSALTIKPPKWGQAKTVELSFKTLALNKNNAAALAKAQEMHDRDMAKLEAMLGS